VLTANGSSTTSAIAQPNLTFDGTTLAVTGNLTTTSSTSNSVGGMTLSNSVLTVPTGLFLPWLSGGQGGANPQTYIYAGAASPTQTSTRWGDGTGWLYNFLGNSTRTSNVLTLVDNGNVGINCNSPQRALDVTGSGSFYNSGEALRCQYGNAVFRVRCDGSAYGGVYMNGYVTVGQAGTDNNTIFFTVPSDGNQSAWYSNGSGGFGIGTTSPAYKLDVNGTGRYIANGTVSTSSWAGCNGTDTLAVMTNAATGVNSNGVASILFGNSTAANFPYGRIATIDQQVGTGAYASAMVFQTNGGGLSLAERMRIHSNGNVGINTTTPATTLDVNGGVTIRNGYRPITQIYTTAGPISLAASSYGTHYYITNSSVASITFATAFPNAQTDSNGYWVFRNATGSYLSITITWPSTISNSAGSSISLSGSSTNFVPVPPSNAMTLMFTNGLGNYGLYNNGGTSSNYFAIF
jgi:hypothetical protein